MFIIVFFLFSLAMQGSSEFPKTFNENLQRRAFDNSVDIDDFETRYDEIVNIKGSNNRIRIQGSKPKADQVLDETGESYGFSQKYIIGPLVESLYLDVPFPINNGTIEFVYDASEKGQLKNLCLYGSYWKKDWFLQEIWNNLQAIKLVDRQSMENIMPSGLGENIKEVFIQDYPILETIDLQNKRNLLYFTLTNCNNVKTLLLPEQVEKIRIQNCNELPAVNTVLPGVQYLKLWEIGNFTLISENFPNLKTLIIKSLAQVKNIENLTLLEKLIIKDQGSLDVIDLSGMKSLKHFEIDNDMAKNDSLETITFDPSQKIDLISIQNCKNVKNLTLPDYAGNVCVVSNDQHGPNEQLEKIAFFGHENDASYYPKCTERVILETESQNIQKDFMKFGAVEKDEKNKDTPFNAKELKKVEISYSKKPLWIGLIFIGFFAGFYYNKQIKALFQKYVSQRFNF